MVPLIDRARGAGTIHVLIIGNGNYDEGALTSLDGMGAMVRRIYEWWRTKAGSRCEPGTQVGTIHVLASDDSPISLWLDSGVAEAPERPTRAKVVEALEEWAGRCEQGGMGFLFWAGHGEGVGLDSQAPTTTLFCCDLDTSGEFRGIDWPETQNAINARARGGAKISCFIDACRSEYAPGQKVPGAFGYRAGANVNPAYVLMSAAEGQDAMSYGKALPAVDFAGGPLATNAVHDALDRYAARLPGTGHLHAVTANRINEAVPYRLERIASHIKKLKKAPAVLPASSPIWPNAALLLMHDPHCMFDIQVPAGTSMSSLSCTVTRQGTQHGSKVAVGAKYFEASVPYGSHDVAIVEQANPNKVIYSERVEAAQIHQLVGKP